MARKKAQVTKIIVVPVSLEETNGLVRQIGEKSRQIQAIEAGLTAKIEELKKAAESEAQVLADEISDLLVGVYHFSEDHRKELTEDDKRKTVNLSAGDLGWRTTPPKVSIGNNAKVLAALKELKLQRFIRTKEEPDKESMLREPEVARTIKGVKITQTEVFFVKPAEASVVETPIENLRKRKVS